MLNKINLLISQKEKKKLFLLSFLLILSTIVEIISIGSIPIFATILIDTSFVVQKLSDYIKLEFISKIDQKEIIVYGSIFLVLIFTIKNIIISLINYFNGTITRSVKSTLAERLFRKYIFADYEYFLSKNSAEIIRNVTSEVSRTSIYIFSHVLLFKELLIVISVFILLFSVDYLSTIIIFISLPLVSGFYYLFIAKSSKERGKIFQVLTEKYLKTLNHSLGSIKFLKIFNKENFMINIFDKTVESMEHKEFIQRFIVSLPKIFLETVTIIMFAIICFIFVSMDKSFQSFVPFISLICVSAVRIIPSLSLISASITNIKFNQPAFDLICKELETQNFKDLKIDTQSREISFKKEILIKNVSFRYPGTTKDVLKNLDLKIKYGEKIGITGESGAGKSTFLDIISGLIKPTNGSIFVDNISFENKTWGHNLGYVPQDIYLLDDTIKANIAFGEDIKDFDHVRFTKSLKTSNLDVFVKNLDKKENTYIGDRGIRMSGGQRQRIGIARCIYFEPKIIILDEPTSSLDLENEKIIMEDIYKLKNYTIIIISHRHSILKNCDRLFKIENNHLIDVNSFSEL